MTVLPPVVLFLCTGNSARSILAEAILGRLGEGRYVARSAGSQPAGRVNPYALDLLRREGFDISDLRSKSWTEFDANENSPPIDFVITVCDSAAAESCPVWPGHPMTAHWGIPDPAAAAGSEADRRRAFVTAYRQLAARIDAFLAMPIEALDRDALRSRLAEIGQGSFDPATDTLL